MERGVRREAVFRDDFDRSVFLEIVRMELEKNHCKLHAYCLMTNHFHMLLETDDMEVYKFMKAVASKYAMQFNHRHACHGHVFEARYKSCLVETDEYFLQTGRYIHLNPVKAKMVERPEDFGWSSYRTVLGMCDDRISERDRTLRYFGKKGACGYREFVEDSWTKYAVQEDAIKKSMGEDDLWLPW